MPEMTTILVPVTDVGAAKKFYGALLGVEPTVDEPYYVHYVSGSLQLGLNPQGARQGLTGPTPYWMVADIAAAIASLEATGATMASPPVDVGGGRLVALVKDTDGNVVGVMQDPV